MYTLGRSREKASAVRHLRSKRFAASAEAVVDAAHDMLEMIRPEAEVRELFRGFFVDGGREIGELAGSWLGSLTRQYPSFLSLWQELAVHRLLKVRSCVASCLFKIPAPGALDIAAVLIGDRSPKIRCIVTAELAEFVEEQAHVLLKERLAVEKNASVTHCLQLSLDRSHKLMKHARETNGLRVRDI